MSRPKPTNVLIVGGGVVGLSIAWELAQSGRSVRLLERGQTGKEASWAGAGILPPGSWFSDHPSLIEMAAHCYRMNAVWSDRLRDATGVDDQLTHDGALYAITPASQEHLRAKFALWSERGIELQRLSANEVANVAPQIQPCDAYFVPREAQVRNPRRLEALRRASVAAGVVIETDAAVQAFETEGGRIAAVRSPRGNFAAADIILAAGAWTGALAEQLGVRCPTRPIRGQMLLFKLPKQLLTRIYHEDGKYFVPRRDGHVLVGTTVEDVGFHKSVEQNDLRDLQEFAGRVAPCLRDATIAQSWAGLRPAGGDELPMIGRLPRYDNAWIAAGHFRSGLQFAPVTAQLVREMLGGTELMMDTRDFDPMRFAPL